MAVPKSKVTRSRRGKRRSHDSVKPISVFKETEHFGVLQVSHQLIVDNGVLCTHDGKIASIKDFQQVNEENS